MERYSIIIPCYKSSKTIHTVVQSTIEEFAKIGIKDYEFVLVNDCSPDDGATRDAIFNLADRYPFVKAIDLGKNSGQHNALLAALHYTTGDYIISMDDDMQCRPSEIIKLINKMNEGYDVVYGYYEDIQESLFRRFGSFIHYLTVRYLMRKPKSLKTSSFWIIRKYVRDYAIQYTYPGVAMQGLFLRITSHITCTPLQHYEREIGTSGYTLKKLLRQYSNDMAFSVRLLDIALILGLIVGMAGILGAVALGIARIVNPVSSLGLGFISCLIVFLSGVIMTSVGILGNYLGRLYMGQTKDPQFVVRESRNILESETDT